MLESTWLFIGFVALCATAVALSTKTQAATLYGDDDGVAIFAGIIGFVSWGMTAYGSLNLRVVGDSTIHTLQMAGVTYWCIAMALIPAYIALTGPAEAIHNRYRQPKPEEV